MYFDLVSVLFLHLGWSSILKKMGLTVILNTLAISIMFLDKKKFISIYFLFYFSASVEEGKKQKIILFTASATDRDIDINALITYTLVDDFNAHFAIDSKTGQFKILFFSQLLCKSTYIYKYSATLCTRHNHLF